MALKPEAKKKIATLLKIKEADLETALKDEKEVDLEIPENIEVLTKEELEARDAAQKKAGEKDGKEIGIKEVKKAAGLPEDAPSKDPVKVAQAIIDKAVTDAKVKPDEQVKQLKDQVQMLQTQMSEKEKEIETSKSAAATAAMDRKILASFPKDRTNILNDDELLTLVKSGYTFKEQDGTVIVEKDGKPIRDSKTTNPLALSDALQTIFTERKWIGGGDPPPGGRPPGGGAPPAKFTKLSEIKEQFTRQNKSLLGAEFSDAVSKAAAENKEFDMNG